VNLRFRIGRIGDASFYSFDFFYFMDGIRVNVLGCKFQVLVGFFGLGGRIGSGELVHCCGYLL